VRQKCIHYHGNILLILNEENMSILISGDFHASARSEIDLIHKEILIDKYGQEK